MTACEFDPIGISELAEMFGVKPSTVHMWRYRDQMPEPDYPAINGHPAWDRSVIIAWAFDTGRLDESYRAKYPVRSQLFEEGLHNEWIDPPVIKLPKVKVKK
jgi:hypothetical protein